MIHPPGAEPSRFRARVYEPLERFFQIEASSGIVLLAAALIALVWANSPGASSYEQLIHLPITLGVGSLHFDQTIHFWINDGLMTIFFLLVGLEIRRELHEGALATLRTAVLPFAAALGGVIIPALLYLSLNADESLRRGWAVPTATDIAFAIGVLTLLGRRVPSELRVLLLAIAIIDDIVAILVIALFYSDGISINGLLVAATGILGVLAFRKLGVRSTIPYLLPGAVVWAGLLSAGVHPALAGAILGLLTPVVPFNSKEGALGRAMRAIDEFRERSQHRVQDPHRLSKPVQELKHAQREMLAPVVRVQLLLHPWVAYGIMPIFALANAGVDFSGITMDSGSTAPLMMGVAAGLVLGKPVGILLTTWLVVKLRWCALPPGVDMKAVLVIGCLAGIGFTMSIFICDLAFAEGTVLATAKLAVLVSSAVAGSIGLFVGKFILRSGPLTVGPDT